MKDIKKPNNFLEFSPLTALEDKDEQFCWNADDNRTGIKIVEYREIAMKS